MMFGNRRAAHMEVREASVDAGTHHLDLVGDRGGKRQTVDEAAEMWEITSVPDDELAVSPSDGSVPTPERDCRRWNCCSHLAITAASSFVTSSRMSPYSG